MRIVWSVWVIDSNTEELLNDAIPIGFKTDIGMPSLKPMSMVSILAKMGGIFYLTVKPPGF